MNNKPRYFDRTFCARTYALISLGVVIRTYYDIRMYMTSARRSIEIS